MHLFFDLDNTLWDFDKNSERVLRILFIQFSLAQKLNTDFDSFHSFYVKKNNELWELYYFNKIKKEELRFKRFYDSFLNFGHDDLKLSKEMAEEYLRISPHGKDLKSNCIETLEILYPKYHLHIITNGFDEVQNIKIDNCGLRKYFKEIIISENHGFTKPNLAIFTLAQQLTTSTKETSVMVGDNFISDIQGAMDAGWKAVYFNSEAKKNAGNEFLQISDLSELTDMF